MKLVYCTPALYMAGGVERVLTMKANYLAEQCGYDITIILTEGKGKPLFYPLSDKIKIINLDVNFEVLWNCSFAKKIFVYLNKQRIYKKLLTEALMEIHPDVTVSLLRREIDFITGIKDGSKKVGELHVNRANYRNFEQGDSNFIKKLFSKFWMESLVRSLKKLDRFVVLTEEDKAAWQELNNVQVIPNPLSFVPKRTSDLSKKRIVAVGRYTYQKGFDLLLNSWSQIEKQHPDWSLAIYGDGERDSYIKQAEDLGIDMSRCHLNPPTQNIQDEYLNSSAFVFSSRYEGFGIVLIEAMACGLPVISFDCPCGPKDIITEGSGVLVPAGNVEALAQAMDKMISDENARKTFAENGLKRVKDYELSAIGNRWRELFEIL